MFTSTSNADRAQPGAADVLIPVIRTAATIGFAIAPCSLGFVIIAVSEQLIRSIMVGDDPEMLVSDLQNQFPDEALEILENDQAGLVPKVVDLIERPGGALELPLDADGIRIDVLTALHEVPSAALSSEDHSYAE
jgi:AraC family transcriptional regulator of adaptative response/methylated-DNA-[protein]-cysteine methyltransferase